MTDRGPAPRAHPMLVALFFVVDATAIVLVWRTDKLVAVVPILLGLMTLAGLIAGRYLQMGRTTSANIWAAIALLMLVALPILGIVLFLQIQSPTL
jgi:hypothetical protein